MRVFISSDMEGTAGVSGWPQVMPQDPDYIDGRRLMIEEVNAAIDGAFAGGAGEVVVNDSHDGMRNLLADRLDARAQLISGSPKTWSMVEGLDSSFDLMLCTGYHAMAGSAGTLAHSFYLNVHHVELCGRPAGELAFNAYLAGAYGVPVGAVTGDDVLEREALALIPGVHFARVKQSRGRYAAQSLSAEAARALIRATAATACRESTARPLLLPEAEDKEIVVDFLNAVQAQGAALCPGARRVGATTVSYAHRDYREVYRAWLAMIALAGSGR